MVRFLVRDLLLVCMWSPLTVTSHGRKMEDGGQGEGVQKVRGREIL